MPPRTKEVILRTGRRKTHHASEMPVMKNNKARTSPTIDSYDIGLNLLGKLRKVNHADVTELKRLYAL